jgi:uncharacterized protein involved in exopolysaccharide biosynthesis/Mrp family chromosome partitioning ATPase
MNATPPTAASSPGITAGDIYYVLFRHKWKILACTMAGLIAAAGLYRFNAPPAQSEAKLYIRYVISEGKAMGPVVNDQTKSPDQRGETIMESEQQILTSFDLAKQVAETVGPAKILAKAGGGKDLNRAAAVVHNGLYVTVPWGTSVIDIIFTHPDLEIVQSVLREVVDRYRKRHVEIHQSAGVLDESLAQETDTLRSQLAQTEEDLRKAISKAGVISLSDAKKTEAEQIARIRDEIRTAEADFAERSALLQAVTRQSAPAASAVPAPDTGANPAPSATPVPSAPPATPEVTAAQIDAYKVVSARVDLLRRTEQDLLTQFTENNSRVQDVRSQLGEAQGNKKKLEEENPGLLRSAPAASVSSGPSTPSFDLGVESAHLIGLQSKIKLLNAQLEAVRTEAAGLNQMEGQITELQRRRDLQDTNYRYYAARQDQARIDDALGNNGRVSGISLIQEPTPPTVDNTKTLKLVKMVAAAGLAAGIAWAFLIELYLDRTVRRPIDVERLLKLPLFLSIPNLGGSARRRLKASQKNAELKGKAGVELVPWDGAHELHPFHETLRDRLIGYFESRNLTHKPKLLAVTGLGRNSGVTTTAAGLASCLSETGEGNVLLVDMTPGHGSAQQFYRGKPVAGFEELFEVRETAQIQDKLYVVAEGSGGEKLSGILPHRFSKLVPKLKASNFDYIIFDMPPVSQISITPRLAGFMDMVLLVIESEKTDRDLVQRAADLLAQSKANIGAVLNKTKHYVPRRLHQDREFLLGS